VSTRPVFRGSPRTFISLLPHLIPHPCFAVSFVKLSATQYQPFCHSMLVAPQRVRNITTQEFRQNVQYWRKPGVVGVVMYCKTEVRSSGYLLVFEAAANFIPHVHVESLSFSILVYVVAIPIRERVSQPIQRPARRCGQQDTSKVP
jgi:hypothetical protein